MLFTGIAFLGAGLALFFAVITIANFGKDSGDVLLNCLTVSAGLAFCGCITGSILLGIQLLTRIGDQCERSADALAKIVESQSRKKAS